MPSMPSLPTATLEDIFLDDSVHTEGMSPTTSESSQGIEPDAETVRFVKIYKSTRHQRCGVRFFRIEDARERGARTVQNAIVAVVNEEGCAYKQLLRGDRVVSMQWTRATMVAVNGTGRTVNNVIIQSPEHAAETLRHCEGYVTIGLLPPDPDMDLTRTEDEVNQGVPLTTSPCRSGKPILSDNIEERVRQVV